MAFEKVVGLRSFIFFLAFWLLTSFAPAAQEHSTAPMPAMPLRVALFGLAPFVIENDGTLDGFSIDVWEHLAAANTWSFVYKRYPTAEAAIKAVTDGQADIVVGDVSIVAPLFSSVEFSQPYFRAGLQIMVAEGRPYSMSRMFEDIWAWLHFELFWIFVGGVVVISVGVMFFERKHNPDFPKKWSDGFAEALYYVVSLSLGKSGYKGFGGWFGRLVMIIWTVVGVLVVIIVTSRVTAAMTTEAFNSRITGPKSLPGKTVGAVTGTRAITYLQHHSITFNEYGDWDEAVKKLLKGDVPALVGPAPVLQTYDKEHPTLNITEIGAIFEHYNYGFAMPIGSPLRVPLNRALLEIQENGELLKIGQEYFGEVFQL